MKSHCTITTDDKAQIRERSLLKLLFASLPKNGTYRITAESFKERSTPLNDYYWKILCDVIQPALYEAGNDGIRTKEDAHEFFKKLFKIKSTQLLNDKEMLAYLEEIFRYCSEYLSICIPSPNSTQNFV